MIHVKKCSCKYGRGNPTTEFYINGKPQIYCYGWINLRNDEPLECCKNCKDWVDGEQCIKDFEEAKKQGILGRSINGANIDCCSTDNNRI